jgi:hypothetical protein
MYRIRSATGAEANYNSLEEFTAAVRRGEVAPDDEIFHSRANRWLDVKSHPHYRTAMNSSGSGSGASLSAPPASVSTPPPRPAINPGQTNGHAPPTRVGERPGVSRPVPPTVYRTQLPPASPPAAPQAPSPPPASAAPPPRKSKELTFIDLGNPAQAAGKNGTDQGSPPPPGTAKPPTPVNELDFLVMATGMESPVRKSNGHKVVSEDLDLLFDTPVADAVPPAQPAAVAVPHPGPVAPAPQPPEPPSVPAPKPVLEAPRPEQQRGVTVKAVIVREPEDLSIPGHAWVDAPVATAAEATPVAQPIHTTVPGGRSYGFAVVAGAVALVAAGALFLWRPWSGTEAQASATQQTRPSQTSPSAPPEGLMPQGLVASGAEVTTSPAAPSRTDSIAATGARDSALPADSGPAAPAEEIIATRPEFRAPVEVSPAELSVDADLGTASSATSVAPSELIRRLEASERQAQQELNTRLTGFRNVFGGGRLASREGVNQARAAWISGADAIRQYRVRIARLQLAYEDSVLASQRASRWSGEDIRKWASRRSLAEPAETSQMADLMFSQVAEALDILSTLDGQYELKGDRIRFRNPVSGTRFMSVRTWVEQRIDNWSSTPESARPFTVTAILQALGQGLPAVE